MIKRFSVLSLRFLLSTTFGAAIYPRAAFYGGLRISRGIQDASRPLPQSCREYQTFYREQGEMKLSVSAYTAQASAHKNLCSYQHQRSYGATNQASTARTPSDLATVLPALKVYQVVCVLRLSFIVQSFSTSILRNVTMFANLIYKKFFYLSFLQDLIIYSNLSTMLFFISTDFFINLKSTFSFLM